ncbi:MAG: subclass B1 metallo-beta-lactamase [Bacteroidota bacterium]
MKNFKPTFLLLIGILLITYVQAQNLSQIYNSDDLVIEKISDQVYVHISYLEFKGVKYPCNGLIYKKDNEIVIVDTPPDNKGAEELISWAEKHLGGEIKAVIASHFHKDCLGGLEAFHKKGIASYANKLTQKLVDAKSKNIPEHIFEEKLFLLDSKVECRFLGEGHTRDNIVVYLPEEKTLFGGCLVKSIDATKGNLEDANIIAWPATIQKVKETYTEAEVVIPGHGAYGDSNLLDYTIELFKN